MLLGVSFLRNWSLLIDGNDFYNYLSLRLAETLTLLIHDADHILRKTSIA